MEKKDGYLYLEAILTFFLLVVSVFAFGSILAAQRSYLITGLLCVFCLGWFMRNKKSRLLTTFITIAVFGDLAWTAYLVLNSSFFYKDIILISVKSLIFLEIILGLGAWSYPFLAYIQVLCVLLFMSHPILNKAAFDASSIVYVAVYLIIWFFILKLKFYEFFNPYQEKNKHNYFFAALFFIVISLCSSVLFFRFSFKETRWPGLFEEQDLKGRSESIKEGKGDGGQYYDLQDKIQKEVTRLVPELNSTQARHEALFFFSSLIKESSDAIEVEIAETGLINNLGAPELALERKDIQGLSGAIRDYVDKKIDRNFKNATDNTVKALKEQPFNIKDILSVMSHINKIRYAGNLQKIKEEQAKIQNNINNSSLGPVKKNELNNFMGQLGEWRAFELYRNSIAAFNGQKESLNVIKEDAVDLISKIKSAQDLAGLKEADSQLRALKQKTPPHLQGFMKKTEDILGLKLEMFLDAKNEGLKERLEEQNLTEGERREIEQDSADLRNAKDGEDFAKAAARLKEIAAGQNQDISQQISDLSAVKAYSLAQGKKQEIAEELEKTVLSDQKKKDFLASLGEMDSSKGPKKLDREAQKLESGIDKYSELGFISKKDKEALKKDMTGLKNLLSYQPEMGRKGSSKHQGSNISGQDWTGIAEKMPLGEESKEALDKLSDDLYKADSLSRLNDIQQAVENEIGPLAKEASGENQMPGATAGSGSAAGVGNEAGGLTASGGTNVGASGEGTIKRGAIKGEASEEGGGVGKTTGEGPTPISGKGTKESPGGGAGQNPEGGGREGAKGGKKKNEEPGAGPQNSAAKKEQAQEQEFKKSFEESIAGQKSVIMNNVLSDFKKSIGEFKKNDQKNAVKLEELLKNIATSQTEEELKNRLEDLGKEISRIESQMKDAKLEGNELADYNNLVNRIKAGFDKIRNNLAAKQERKLVSIKIIPGNLEVALGEKGQFKARGVYNNNKEEDVTLFADWVTENDKVAEVSKGTVYSLAIGETRARAKFRGIESASVPLEIKGPKLISIILFPGDSQISMKDRLRIKAEGRFSDNSAKDITSLVNWNITGQGVIKLNKGIAEPLRIGEARVSAEYSGIKSLPIGIKVRFTMQWLVEEILKAAFSLALGISVIFLVLYLIVKRNTRKLALLFRDPRMLTIELYGNIKIILKILGLSETGFLSSRSYALLVREKYNIENAVFLNLTKKFEEANYSKHYLPAESSRLVICDYNEFLKLLFNRFEGFSLFSKYCLVLLHRRPLFIKTPVFIDDKAPI